MEQLTQSLWNWAPSPGRSSVQSSVSVEDDLASALPMLASIIGADEAVLTLHCDADVDTPPRVFRSGECPAQVGSAGYLHRGAPDFLPIQEFGPLPSQPEWTSWMLEGRLCPVLRVPVPSRRARSTAMLEFLFRTASASSRAQAGERLMSVRPMIETYLKLWQRTRTKGRGDSGLRCALDTVESGILLLNRDARITFANKAAAELLKPGDPLRRVGDGLTTSDLRQSPALQAALSHAIGSNADDDRGGHRRAPVLSLRAQRADRNLVVSVIPAEDQATEPQDVAAIVYLFDPKADRSGQLQVVCTLFGLWPVEARLVCLLSEGKTLQETAEAMRIKDQTARTYLKQIFLKTGTRRQADLVRVMLSSMVRVERSIEPECLQERADLGSRGLRR